MDAHQQAVQLLKELRQKGLSLDRALDELREKKFGLLPVIKALRAVEGVSYADATAILERRGDYKSF